MPMTPGQIRKDVGGRIYSRGLDYHRSNAVTLRDVEGDFARASVKGTDVYIVSTSLEGPRLRGSCTCPAAEESSVCKHMVAVALAVLADPTPRRDGGLVSRWLAGLQQFQLRDMLMQQALRDFSLFRRFLVEAAIASTDRKDTVHSVSMLVQDALRLIPSDLSTAREAVSQARIGLQLLIDRGFAQEACDQALALMRELPPPSRSYFREDDYDDEPFDDDEFDGFDMIVELHARACGIAARNPREVASEVFELCTADGERFGSRFESYVDALGPDFAKEWAVLDGGRRKS